MSVRRINIPSATSKFQQVVQMDGVSYTLVFRWNERAAHWFLTIRNSAGDNLVTGRKLVADVPFAAHETIAGFMPGTLWVRDVSGQGIDPGLRDLDDRVVLMYVDEDNVA